MKHAEIQNKILVEYSDKTRLKTRKIKKIFSVHRTEHINLQLSFSAIVLDALNKI